MLKSTVEQVKFKLDVVGACFATTLLHVAGLGKARAQAPMLEPLQTHQFRLQPANENNHVFRLTHIAEVSTASDDPKSRLYFPV